MLERCLGFLLAHCKFPVGAFVLLKFDTEHIVGEGVGQRQIGVEVVVNVKLLSLNQVNGQGLVSWCCSNGMNCKRPTKVLVR